MSARITPQPLPADDHAGALGAAFASKAHLVYRIELFYQRPPGGWKLFANLLIANNPDDPVAPDELIKACHDRMRDELGNGAAKFKVCAFGRKEDGSETATPIIALEAGLDPPATADQRATAETNALVSTNEMLRRHCEDEHRQKMDMFKVAIEIPKTTVQVLQAMPEAMGKTTAHYDFMAKALGYHYQDRDEERASRERIEEEKNRQANISRMFDKLEPLAMGWLMKIMAEAGIDPSAFAGGFPGAPPSSAPSSGTKVTQEASKTATAVKVFCKSLTDEEKVKIIDAFSDDCLAVLFAAADAPTEQAAVACLKKLRELLKDRDAMSTIMTLRGIVGDRIVPLVPILKPIFEEKP